MKTYIIGHKNPDTDSVVSAIVLAELENSLGKDYIAAVADKTNKETDFVLEKFGSKMPKPIPDTKKEVILVDHNELSQMSEKVRAEEIIGILDHHKLGGLSTLGPISVRIKPVGATSTLIAELFKEKRVNPSKKIASLLIAGILSDTLNLTSPITTKTDQKIIDELNAIADLNIYEFANQMFEAKSDLNGIPISEIVTKDYKEFKMGGMRVGAGVWETVSPKSVLEKKKEILEALRAKKDKEGLNLLFFGLVDILKKATYLFILGDEEKKVVEEVFKTKTKEEILELPGVVSRKKQIIPFLEKFLK